MKTKDLAGLLHRLERPTGPVDVVLDTDTYNEVDDQFALSYLLASQDQLRVKALYAAPFFNENSTGPADGMEKSYQEILKLLGLAGCQELREVVFRGSASYLPDEVTPVPSPAAEDLARRAMGYSPEAPLYVVAIGALTNIASALLLEPAIAQRITLVWLGGNAWDWPDNQEFNAFQDVAADRVVFGSGAAVVQLPCQGVVSAFRVSGPELRQYLQGKSPLCDYLVELVEESQRHWNAGPCWTRPIWDVTAVGWLLGERFMLDRLEPSPIFQYDHHYSFDKSRHPMRYVYHIQRDELFADLFEKLPKLGQEQKRPPAQGWRAFCWDTFPALGHTRDKTMWKRGICHDTRGYSQAAAGVQRRHQNGGELPGRGAAQGAVGQPAELPGEVPPGPRQAGGRDPRFAGPLRGRRQRAQPRGQGHVLDEDKRQAGPGGERRNRGRPDYRGVQHGGEVPKPLPKPV